MNLPNLCSLASPDNWPEAPDEKACIFLWNKYEMLPNIREHSLTVAKIASAIAKAAFQQGYSINPALVKAAALLHDLAKTWCIRHGGSHAQLGASWALMETGNYGISQGVLLHVHWPWKLPEGENLCILPIIIMYADKRVKHSVCVTLKERFDDLLIRYGKTTQARQGILISFEQARKIETGLSKLLGWNLDEYSFDCRGLVD